MPRNLSRLRFRAPTTAKPLNLARIPLENRHAVQSEVRDHVLSLSKPATALSLQVVVNRKWKDMPGTKTRKLTYKPHTLRDLVDPQGEKKHGQIIYIFKNIRTKQVIYSLAELLDVGLPFAARERPLTNPEIPSRPAALHRQALEAAHHPTRRMGTPLRRLLSHRRTGPSRLPQATRVP